MPGRDKFPSAHDIAKEVASELSGAYRPISTTPPAIRWLQKWWWKISLGVAAEGLTHLLHELIVRGLRR